MELPFYSSFITTALDVDCRQIASSDGFETIFVVDQPVTGIGAGSEGFIAIVPYETLDSPLWALVMTPRETLTLHPMLVEALGCNARTAGALKRLPLRLSILGRAGRPLADPPNSAASIGLNSKAP